MFTVSRPALWHSSSSRVPRLTGFCSLLLTLPRSFSSSALAMTTPEYHDVVIVGGGVGGLYTAKKLMDAGLKDVVVLESRQWLGGRVQTKRDEKGRPIFNDFAWRVGEENNMMIQLAKELGITLRPQTTPTKQNKSDIQIEDRPMIPNRAPLSAFAKASLQSASAADQQDRESGYAGRTSQISWPGETHGELNYVVEEGMAAYATELAKLLPEGCVRMLTRVADVRKLPGNNDDAACYEVSAVKRTFKSNTPCTLHCKSVVLATPPYPLRSMSVAKDMLPALFAVHERRLGHAYVKVKQDTTANVPDTSDGPDRIYHMLPDSILQQIISGDYGHGAGAGIFQAAYACDRFERVWRELQYQGPESLKDDIKKQLSRIGDVDPELYKSIEEVFLRIGFVHRWKIEAHVAGKNKEELSLQAIHPNPARLPNLYLVGEAFSPCQGWTEGALWTADKAAGMIASGKGHSEFTQLMTFEKDEEGKFNGPASGFLLYHGHVIDGKDWVERHPGGPHPIKAFMDRDMSEFFDSLHGGWPEPLGTLFGLQIGTTEQSGP